MISPASFARAHEMYLTPPDYPDSRVQVEGFFIFHNIREISDLNLGELDDFSWSEAEISEEDDCLRIWCTAWLDCEPDGSFPESDLGDLQSAEVVDTENVIPEPDPDQEWDNRDMVRDD